MIPPWVWIPVAVLVGASILGVAFARCFMAIGTQSDERLRREAKK